MYSFFMYFVFFSFVSTFGMFVLAGVKSAHQQTLTTRNECLFLSQYFSCHFHTIAKCMAQKQQTSYYYYVYGRGYIVYYTGWTTKRQWCSPFYGFRFLFGNLALSLFWSQTHSCSYTNRLDLFSLSFLSLCLLFSLSYSLFYVQILLRNILSHLQRSLLFTTYKHQNMAVMQNWCLPAPQMMCSHFCDKMKTNQLNHINCAATNDKIQMEWIRVRSICGQYRPFWLR